jgi:hypothetical protein
MPISADEFSKSSSGTNEIEKLLRSNPDKTYSLHEIEEEIIGKEMNRRKHLDVFIADLTLLTLQSKYSLIRINLMGNKYIVFFYITSHETK